MSLSRNYKLKAELQERFSSLRVAARELKIDYSRLSQLVNGWARPRVPELLRFQELGFDPKIFFSPTEK